MGRPRHRDRGGPLGRRHDQDQHRQDPHVHEVPAAGGVQAGRHGEHLQLLRRDHGEVEGRDELPGPGPEPVVAQRRPDHAQRRRPGRLPDSVLEPAERPAPLHLHHRHRRRVHLLHRAPGPGPDARDHVDRAVQGQGVHDRAALAPPSPTWPATTGSSWRSARSSTSSRPRPASRRSAPRSPRASCWSARPGTGKTLLARAVAGEAGVPFMSVSRLGLHGDVRRRRRQPGPRPVPDGPQAGAGHHLHRRDRLHRPQARRRARRRPRRAGADAQPDARPRWTASRRPRAS